MTGTYLRSARIESLINLNHDRPWRIRKDSSD